ncbi:PKD1L2 [Mytilus edulis]|uniref:PKD1L2 n=1 Tax=Mytilus edulis TaxID=6550 RepID=A0A8S3TQU2_MYTED|nr:PKD1L2 [Mytilus edulis]
MKNRLSIDYNWRLFKLGASGPVEIMDFATWTDTGQAFSSKFTFSCGGWLDEGTRPARDPVVDRNYLYGYTFTFSYQVMDAVENPIVPFFQVSGSEVDTPGVVLPSGKIEYDHIVTPFSEDSGHDVMEGFENNVCVRERDMSCILTFCDGLADTNTSHVKDVKAQMRNLLTGMVSLCTDNLSPMLLIGRKREYGLRPDDTTANITYYVRKWRYASQHTYDMKAFILTDSEVEDSTNSYLVKMDISGLWTGRERLPTMVYIDWRLITVVFSDITEVSPMAEVAVLVLGCYYWSRQDKQWSQRGVISVYMGAFIRIQAHTSKVYFVLGGKMRDRGQTTARSRKSQCWWQCKQLPVSVPEPLGTNATDEFINEEAIEMFISEDIPTDIDSQTDNGSQTDIDSQTDNDSQTDIDLQTDNDSQTDIDLQTDNDSQHDIDAQKDIDSQIDNDSQTDNDAHTDIDSQTDNDSQTDHDSVAKRRRLDIEADIDCIILHDLLTEETDTVSETLSLTSVDSTHDKIRQIVEKNYKHSVQNTMRKYAFLCDKWFAFDKGQGQIDHMIPVASAEEMQSFGHLFFSKTRKDMTDGHLWFSVASRPLHSTFTRAQRLSCCLSLLFMTMITNCMWYKSDSNEGDISQNVHLGPFTFSSQEFFTSLFGTLIVVPFNLLIITLFRKSKPHTHASTVQVESNHKEEKKRDSMAQFNRELDCASPSNIDTRFTPSPQPAWDEERR